MHVIAKLCSHLSAPEGAQEVVRHNSDAPHCRADIVLPIGDYNKLLSYSKQRGALDACQVYNFDGLIKDLYQLSWQPYSGKLHYLSEFYYQEQAERSTFQDRPGEDHSFLEVCHNYSFLLQLLADRMTEALNQDQPNSSDFLKSSSFNNLP